MSNISFFHCGDIHLDIPFTSLSKKLGLSRKRREDIKESFNKLINIAKIESPDFLFIAGDLYEHEYSNIKTIKWLNNKFSEIEKTKIILISGNHDQESNNSFYKTIKWNNNVYYLGEEKNKIFFKDLNTEVYGIGFSVGIGLKKQITNIECKKDRTNILLFHGDIDLDIGMRDYNAITSDELENKDFQYIGANHNHKYRNNIGKKGIIHNSGSIEALGFDEEGKHGFIRGYIKNDILETFFVVIDECKYKNINIKIDKNVNEEKLLKQISNIKLNKKYLYRIELNGTREVNSILNIKKIEKLLNEQVAFLKIKDNTKITNTEKAKNNKKNIKAIFIKKAMDLMENETEEKKEIIKQAIIYGIQAIENQEVELAFGED